MNWLHYLAEANLYLIVFYLTYQLLLARETYSQLNRIYLLFSCVAAFVLPILQLGILKPAEPVTVNQTYPVELFYPELNQVAANHVVHRVEEHHLTWQDYLIYAYAIGCAILLLALLVKLFVLTRMIRNAKRERRGQYKLIYLPESDVAFSFFNYLFIGTDAVGQNTIIRHELVHIHQKHSLDILFVELLKIVNWFNPFIYLLQNSLKTIHEYIADEHTAAYENDTLGYATFLVNNAYGAGGSSITHSFFNYNLLKKRIIMLNQQRSGTSARLKYLITAPVFAGLLCASTLAFSKDYGWIDLDPANAFTRLEMLPPIMPSAAAKSAKIAPQTLSGILANGLKNTPARFPPPVFTPRILIIVDGKIAHPKPDETVIADTMTDVPANTDWAIKKWGDKAKNGVRIFSGNTQIIKKSAHPYINVDRFGGRIGTRNLRNSMISYNPTTLFVVNGKKQSFDVSQIKPNTLVSISCDSMIVYDEGNRYAQSEWGNDVGKVVVLKGDAASVKLINWSVSKVKLDTATFNAFYTELARNIKYPAIVRSSNVTGKVFAVFSVDDNGNLQYLKIVRSISNSASEEVFRVIKTSSVIKKMPGNWVVPVNFTLNDEYGTAATLSTSLPASELKKKTFEYNPNNITPSDDNQKMLNEIVIRGYVKRAKN